MPDKEPYADGLVTSQQASSAETTAARHACLTPTEPSDRASEQADAGNAAIAPRGRISEQSSEIYRCGQGASVSPRRRQSRPDRGQPDLFGNAADDSTPNEPNATGTVASDRSEPQSKPTDPEAPPQNTSETLNGANLVNVTSTDRLLYHSSKTPQQQTAVRTSRRWAPGALVEVLALLRAIDERTRTDPADSGRGEGTGAADTRSGPVRSSSTGGVGPPLPYDAEGLSGSGCASSHPVPSPDLPNVQPEPEEE